MFADFVELNSSNYGIISLNRAIIKYVNLTVGRPRTLYVAIGMTDGTLSVDFDTVEQKNEAYNLLKNGTGN